MSIAAEVRNFEAAWVVSMGSIMLSKMPLERENDSPTHRQNTFGLHIQALRMNVPPTVL